MAIEIVNGFEGLFIGTVMEINTTTREIAVYLPKLMPAIPYGGISITSRTNLGNLKYWYHFRVLPQGKIHRGVFVR